MTDGWVNDNGIQRYEGEFIEPRDYELAKYRERTPTLYRPTGKTKKRQEKK